MISIISVDEPKTAIGARCISSYLREYGFQTRLILLPFTLYAKQLYPVETLRNLKEMVKDSEFIGISCMTAFYPLAVQVKNALKNISVPLILGGIHATILPEECLNDYNYVCIGEGEEPILEFAKHIKAGKSPTDIKNIWCRINGHDFKNPIRPVIDNLDVLPMPDYDLGHQYCLEGKEIVPMNAQHMQLAPFVVMGSRGCPHSCTYCCNNKLHQIYKRRSYTRYFSIDYLLNHIERAHKLFPEIEAFWIEDDVFLGRPYEEIKKFSSCYKSKFNIPFEVLTSPQTFDRDKFNVLAEAGMYKIIIGIQSGSEYITKDIFNRYYSREKFIEISEATSECNNVICCYDFIIINPYEREEDIVASFSLIMCLRRPFYLFLNSLAFYPGTELYERAKKEGLSISGWNRHSEENLRYAHIIEIKDNKYLNFLLAHLAGYCDEIRCGKIKWAHLRFLISPTMLRCLRFIKPVESIVVDWLCRLRLNRINLKQPLGAPDPLEIYKRRLQAEFKN